MSELDLKITAVEIALASFAREDNEDVRKKSVREEFGTIPYMNIYLRYPEERLQTILVQLQQLKIDENARQRKTITPQGGSMDSNSILRSALRISFKKMHPKNRKVQTLIGNAVAISPTLALSALHGKVSNGDDITLHTNSGALLHGKVILNVFEQDLVDIAVIELINDGEFLHFTPVLGLRPVRLLDSVYIVGYKFDSRDTAIFDSLSGAGVVVIKEGSEYRVIGVHVASHDSTISSPPVKKAKHSDAADYESVCVALASLSSNIHGHSAYTIICEIARVPELFEFLHQRRLIS